MPWVDGGSQRNNRKRGTGRTDGVSEDGFAYQVVCHGDGAGYWDGGALILGDP